MIHHLGGVFDHYVVKYPSCTQLSRLRKVSWSTLKFPLRTLEKSYTGPELFDDMTSDDREVTGTITPNAEGLYDEGGAYIYAVRRTHI